MSGSGPDTIPNVRVWSGVTFESPGVVGRPSRMFVSGPESLPKVWEWS